MKTEKSGGPVSYYLVQIDNPNQGDVSYQAECGDIIEALGMTFNEGCAFKAIWRTAAARTLGRQKEGNNEIYDAEKVVFYAGRMLSQLEYAVVKKQVSDIQACAALDAAIFETAASKFEWPNLDTVDFPLVGSQQKPLFPAHHIAPAEEVKADSVPPGAYMQIDEKGIVTGFVFHGVIDANAEGGYTYTNKAGEAKAGFNKIDLGLGEPSAAMKLAIDGGLTDSYCPYMCFQNNNCNKCGKSHDGGLYTYSPPDYKP